MKKDVSISSTFLHMLAMLFMLCDHLWATLLPSWRWLNAIGRLAFPIFAFMIVEGFFYTHNLKKYMGRLLICAIISEIPFDLMYEGNWFYPFHQNVIWTFLISLCLIWMIEKVKQKNKLPLNILMWIVALLLANILGMITFVDYYQFGIMTVLTFYLFRGKKWWCYLGQFLCLYYINVELFGGFCYVISIFGKNIEIVQQGLALLAFIPIWFYQGKQGYHKKWFQYFCYGFYPAHILILYIIGTLSIK